MNGPGGRKPRDPRVVVYVLPRHIHQLEADINRLHRQFDFWGGKVRVHAPNTPRLVRCNQCDKLGHLDTKCPQYSGLGVRLLFEKPVPYARMQEVAAQAQARLGYLGSGIDEFAPHRKVTLLYDESITSEEILMRLNAIMNTVGPLLHSAPGLVTARERKSECRECNSSGVHDCPFGFKQQPVHARAPTWSSAPQMRCFCLWCRLIYWSR